MDKFNDMIWTLAGKGYLPRGWDLKISVGRGNISLLIDGYVVLYFDFMNSREASWADMAQETDIQQHIIKVLYEAHENYLIGKEKEKDMAKQKLRSFLGL